MLQNHFSYSAETQVQGYIKSLNCAENFINHFTEKCFWKRTKLNTKQECWIKVQQQITQS